LSKAGDLAGGGEKNGSLGDFRLRQASPSSSPDASVSTNLGRRVKAVRPRGDGQLLQGGTDPVDLQLSPKGRHIEPGIAEMNLVILLMASGRSE